MIAYPNICHYMSSPGSPNLLSATDELQETWDKRETGYLVLGLKGYWGRNIKKART